MKFEKVPYFSREEMLKLRRQYGLGGSQAGTICGLNKYQSPYALWLEMTGATAPADLSDNEAVRLGNDLEAYVAERWAEETGKKVRKCNALLLNPEYPFAHACVDRLVVGEDAGLEIKTTSNYEVLSACKKGFPDCYYTQCVHYMAITGAKKWYLCVLVFGRGLYSFELERDEAEIAQLMKLEADFMEKVEKGIPPVIDGTDSTADAIRGAYRESKPERVDLEPVADALEMRQKLKLQIEDLKDLLQETESRIQAYMGTAEAGTYGKYSVTWKTSYRATVDTKAYEADHPACFDNYKKVTATRSFKVAIRKEK